MRPVTAESPHAYRRGGPGDDGHATTRSPHDDLGGALAFLAVQVREFAGAAGGHDRVHAALDHVVGNLAERGLVEPVIGGEWRHDGRETPRRL